VLRVASKAEKGWPIPSASSSPHMAGPRLISPSNEEDADFLCLQLEDDDDDDDDDDKGRVDDEEEGIEAEGAVVPSSPSPDNR